MNRHRTPISPWGAGLAWRFVWLVLVALHVGPLLRLGWSILASDSGSWAALIGLALAQAFFLLKAIDVRWLRLPVRHGSLIALLLMAVLGHGPAAAKGLEQVPVLATATTIVLGVAGAGWLYRRRDSLLPHYPATARIRLLLNLIAMRLLTLDAPHRRASSAELCYAGRAPPL